MHNRACIFTTSVIFYCETKKIEWSQNHNYTQTLELQHSRKDYEKSELFYEEANDLTSPFDVRTF